MGIKNKGLINIHHLNQNQMLHILNLAAELKSALNHKKPEDYKLGKGKDILLARLFYENSTRTRASFEIAGQRLGFNITGFGSTEGSSVKKGESLVHTLDMFDAYQADVLVLRHPLDGAAKVARNRLQIPVFNAGDGKHQHPTQTILDLFTIMEHTGRLDNLEVGLSGDLKYGRTVHTLALALSLFSNNRIHLYSPPNLPMPPSIIQLLEERNTKVVHHDNLENMVPELDIFYQTRIQKERMPDPFEYEKAKKGGVFNDRCMKLTRDGFGLMHPLPIDKSLPGIDPGLDNHPKSIYKKQAGNGIPTRMALMALSLGLTKDLPVKSAPVKPIIDHFYKELPIRKTSPKKEVSIRPIRESGVVIDHMIPYSERLLSILLNVADKKNAYRAATVKSVSRPNNLKGMLMIENRRLTKEELHLIATLSPGARVNNITDAQVTKKLELSLPRLIEGIDELRCPNVSCITRPRHQEHISPRFEKIGSETLQCSYCGHVVSSQELFNHI
ncbi:MAG: aspartate carbamoyltransferase [Myxococcota bacterium]